MKARLQTLAFVMLIGAVLAMVGAIISSVGFAVGGHRTAADVAGMIGSGSAWLLYASLLLGLATADWGRP